MNLLYYSSKFDRIHSLINPEHVLIVFVDLEYEVLYALKTTSCKFEVMYLLYIKQLLFRSQMLTYFIALFSIV